MQKVFVSIRGIPSLVKVGDIITTNNLKEQSGAVLQLTQVSKPPQMFPPTSSKLVLTPTKDYKVLATVLATRRTVPVSIEKKMKRGRNRIVTNSRLVTQLRVTSIEEV